MADEGNDKGAPKRPGIDPRRMTEVVIEIGGDRCRQVLWPLSKEPLRGAWRRGNLVGTTMHQIMQAMPDLPGQHVSLDAARKVGRIFDPLNDPRMAEVLRKAQAVHKEAFRTEAGAAEDKRFEHLTDDEVKTWLYYMRRIVDCGEARVVHGELPTLEQLETLPGRTRTECYNSSSRSRRWREDPELLDAPPAK